MAPPGFKPASSSEDRYPTDLGKHTIKLLRDSLNADSIDFDNDASKPQLQALFALSRLGQLTSRDTPDPFFLDRLTTFCTKTVFDEAIELENMEVDSSGLKGDLIKAWIEAMSDHLPNGRPWHQLC